MKPLDETAEEVCALALKAWDDPTVKATARTLSYDHQADVRALLAVTVANRHLAHIARLGECK